MLKHALVDMKALTRLLLGPKFFYRPDHILNDTFQYACSIRIILITTTLNVMLATKYTSYSGEAN